MNAVTSKGEMDFVCVHRVSISDKYILLHHTLALRSQYLAHAIHLIFFRTGTYKECPTEKQSIAVDFIETVVVHCGRMSIRRDQPWQGRKLENDARITRDGNNDPLWDRIFVILVNVFFSPVKLNQLKREFSSTYATPLEPSTNTVREIVFTMHGLQSAL